MDEAREAALLAGVPGELLIAEWWRPASDGATLSVTDPATGTVVKQVASASAADDTAAVDAASDAFSGWAATQARQRSESLCRTFDLLQERKRGWPWCATPWTVGYRRGRRQVPGPAYFKAAVLSNVQLGSTILRAEIFRRLELSGRLARWRRGQS